MTGFNVPKRESYDVILIGGAIYGSGIAWFLSSNPDFKGSILVVERDPSYAFAGTTHTNSCIRQQFSMESNIHISRFGAEYIKTFPEKMGDARVPELAFHSFGYMFLADTQARMDELASDQELQASCGAQTQHMTAQEIKSEYPFYDLDGILGGNHNRVDEGYFDGNTMFEWWKRLAREGGVEYLANEVTGLEIAQDGTRVEGVILATGETVFCGTVVNCAGTRARDIATMAGLPLPIEPRKRYTFVYSAQTPLGTDCPLTIDPSGVHFRSDGMYFLVGCPPDDDVAVAYDDFIFDHSIWEEKVWPAIASRVPQFEAVKVINSWVGHYDYNTFDHNAIVGFDGTVENFVYCNGFSGHGLQQAPAIANGLAELITYGAYQTLDLSGFSPARLSNAQDEVEMAVI